MIKSYKMKHLILYFAIIVYCYGCTTSGDKTAIQIEDESLKTGKRENNLGLGYLIGMSKEEVYKHSKELEAKHTVVIQDDSSIWTRFETKNFILSNLSQFDYYDGKLFRRLSHVLQERNEPKNDSISDFKTEVLDDVKNGTRPRLSWIRWLPFVLPTCPLSGT